MASQWICRLMGSELGPFTSKQLLEMEAIKGSTKGTFIPRGLHRAGKTAPAIFLPAT
jgi:hypothetical protein